MQGTVAVKLRLGILGGFTSLLTQREVLPEGIIAGRRIGHNMKLGYPSMPLTHSLSVLTQ